MVTHDCQDSSPCVVDEARPLGTGTRQVMASSQSAKAKPLATGIAPKVVLIGLPSLRATRFHSRHAHSLSTEKTDRREGNGMMSSPSRCVRTGAISWYGNEFRTGHGR